MVMVEKVVVMNCHVQQKVKVKVFTYCRYDGPPRTLRCFILQPVTPSGTIKFSVRLSRVTSHGNSTPRVLGLLKDDENGR